MQSTCVIPCVPYLDLERIGEAAEGRVYVRTSYGLTNLLNVDPINMWAKKVQGEDE